MKDVLCVFLSGKIVSGFSVINEAPTVAFDIENSSITFKVIATKEAALKLAPLGLAKGSRIFLSGAEMKLIDKKLCLLISSPTQIISFNKEDFLFEGEVDIENLL